MENPTPALTPALNPASTPNPTLASTLAPTSALMNRLHMKTVHDQGGESLPAYSADNPGAYLTTRRLLDKQPEAGYL